MVILDRFDKMKICKLVKLKRTVEARSDNIRSVG